MAEFELDDSGVMACLMSAAADNKRTKETAGQGSNVSVIVSKNDNNADNKTDNDTALELGKSERAVLLYIADHPKATQGEVAAAVGTGRTAVANHTSALQRKGLLRREGSRKSGTWVVLIDGQGELR